MSLGYCESGHPALAVRTTAGGVTTNLSPLPRTVRAMNGPINPGIFADREPLCKAVGEQLLMKQLILQKVSLETQIKSSSERKQPDIQECLPPCGFGLCYFYPSTLSSDMPRRPVALCPHLSLPSQLLLEFHR